MRGRDESLSTLLAMALAAGTVGPPVPVAGRIEGVALLPYEGGLAVRVNYTGRPGRVSVTRSGNTARVTLAQTELGWRFGASRRFEWNPAVAPLQTFPAAAQSLDLLRIEQGRGETVLVFELPPTVTIDLRQARYAVLVILRDASHAPTLVARAPTPPVAAPAPPRPATLPTPRPEPSPTPVAAAPVAAPPPGPVATPAPAPLVAQAEPLPSTTVAAPASNTADLYRQLFPTATAPAASSTEPTPGEGGDDTGALYSRLFPNAAPAQGASGENMGTEEPDRGSEIESGFPLGPFRLRPTFTLSYVDANASLLDTPGTVRDRYFQFEPGISARAPVRDGSFTAEYLPSFRAGASFDVTKDPSHLLTADLDFPIGSDSKLTVSDRFVASTLDTREADPGGEYFFDLSRFQRNLLSANARLGFAPRLFVELGGAVNHVSFDQSGGFFSYENRLASAGLGYELSPNLRASVSYAYDEVPTPEERPEAEQSASSVLLNLSGDILPLLTGHLSVGYRDQSAPNAALEGRHFQGFTMSGALTRVFSRSSAFSLLLNRSTPVSNFESNGFYVNTSVQASVAAALPWSLTLDTGLGYVWNDYNVPTLELGVPREDRILALYAGLRRNVAQHWWISGFYRRERRESNLADFNTTSDGFLVQVNWGLFGPKP